MTTKNIGHGVTLQVSTDKDGAKPNANFILLAPILDVVTLGMSADEVEVTDFSSSNGVREFIQGLLRQEPVTFTIYYDENEHITASRFSEFYTDKTMSILIEFPFDTASTTKAAIWGEGFITNFSVNIPIGGAKTASMTFTPDSEMIAEAEV